MPVLVAPAVTLDSWRGTGQPSIDADGLTLRPWVTTDAAAVVVAYADPAIQHWHLQSKTPDEAQTWISAQPERWHAGTGADWAVADGDAVVGRIGFRSVDLFEGEAEVAYWVMPDGRGRRVAPRALDALTSWSFTTAGLHRIALRHSVDNQASCRVAERAGYALEGTLRRSGRHADGDHDMHLHARITG